MPILPRIRYAVSATDVRYAATRNATPSSSLPWCSRPRSKNICKKHGSRGQSVSHSSVLAALWGVGFSISILARLEESRSTLSSLRPLCSSEPLSQGRCVLRVPINTRQSLVSLAHQPQCEASDPAESTLSKSLRPRLGLDLSYSDLSWPGSERVQGSRTVFCEP